MSERDPKTGRFLACNSGGGRPKGPRRGDVFQDAVQRVNDFYTSWGELTDKQRRDEIAGIHYLFTRLAEDGPRPTHHGSGWVV